ncbi:MAG: hypothetical protein AAGD04_04545 [Pseudomonadota bacterium]
MDKKRIDLKRVGMVGGTVLTAAAIGYFMQSSGSGSSLVQIERPSEAPDGAAVQLSQASLSPTIGSKPAIEVSQFNTDAIVLPTGSAPSGIVLPTPPTAEVVTPGFSTPGIVVPKEVQENPTFRVAQNADSQSNGSAIVTPTAPATAGVVVPSASNTTAIVVPSANPSQAAKTTVVTPSVPGVVVPGVVQPVATPTQANELSGPSTSTQTATVQPTVPSSADCSVKLEGVAGLAATVDLTLEAPCHAEQIATVVHDGLIFTLKTDEDGKAQSSIPVLKQNAVFLASFADGQGGLTNVEVNSVGFYDRAVLLQSNGDAASLHAREFNDSYDSDTHVRASSPRTPELAARGEGGFLSLLGDETVANAGLAEVYTFPSKTIGLTVDVKLSVEIEITTDNCGRDISAQVIQSGPSQQKTSRDLTLQVPACDAVGDRLIIVEALDDLEVRPES